MASVGEATHTTNAVVCLHSLLYNSVNSDIAKLQRVQTCLTRVVTRSPRFSRSVPPLNALHWFPVHYRIVFKMCTIAYQAL